MKQKWDEDEKRSAASRSVGLHEHEEMQRRRRERPGGEDERRVRFFAAIYIGCDVGLDGPNEYNLWPVFEQTGIRGNGDGEQRTRPGPARPDGDSFCSV